MRKVKVSLFRKQITYSDHWNAAKIYLHEGKEAKRYSYYKYLSSVLFVAFSLEAFLNHVGEEIFTAWEEMEKLPPKSKIAVICEKLAIKLNYGILPWQIIPEIIGIRNKIAHGKNSLLKKVVIVDHDKYDEVFQEFLTADWQKYATKDKAERALREMEKVFRIIFDKAKLKDDYLFNLGPQDEHAQILEEMKRPEG